MPEISQAFRLFLSFFDSKLFLALQIFGGILSLLFLVGIIILTHKAGSLEIHIEHLWRAWTSSPLPKHRMEKRWLAIKKAIKTDDSNAWRSAIIDADSMLDEVVKKLGYFGNTLEERLKGATPYQFPSLDNAWRAHQIRNFIVEDPSYSLSREVAERTIEIYKNIFMEIGILF